MQEASKRRAGGFTLVELMITLAVSAIALALAVPTWKNIVEKREVTAAAEGIVALMNLAQGEAIKRSEEVFFSWYSPGAPNNHDSSWCVGASAPPKSTPCDCRVSTQTANNFCSIGATAAGAADGMPYRLVQTDFVATDSKLLHAQLEEDEFSFEPLRGLMNNISSDMQLKVLTPNKWLFYLHSNSGNADTRNYELQIRVNVTGRVTICTDDDRVTIIGGYPEC